MAGGWRFCSPVFAQSRGTNTGYLLKNARVDTVKVLRNGAVAGSEDYDPYGNDTDWTCYLLYKYANYYYDSNSGFYYLRNRFYDPSIARFISEDTYWTVDNMIYGDKRYAENEVRIPDIESIMQSTNLMAYAMNNPVVYRDENGEAVETILDIVSIGISLKDLINNPSWVNFGFLAWDVGSTILPAIPGSYTYKGAKLVKGVSNLGSFTKSNFRKNLTKLIGDAPSWMKKAEAHHVLPQKFIDWFSSKGLNIHDPRFGTWVDSESHKKWSYSYNVYWEDYISKFPDASDEQIVNYAKILAETFGFDINF